MNKRAKIFFAIFTIFLILICSIIFGAKFVKFAIIAFLLSFIYETMIEIYKFTTVKKWHAVTIKELSFNIQERRSIAKIKDDFIAKIGTKTLFYLHAKYSYMYKNKEYFLSQIYIDEPRDSKLFGTETKIDIEQWINRYKEKIDKAYVNPQKPYEAVLFKDVLPVSIYGKYLMIFGATIVGFITYSYLDLSFFFTFIFSS